MNQTSHTVQRPSAQPPLRRYLALLVVAAAYVALRLGALAKVRLLEDHDSILYVEQLQAFASFDWARIDALSPDVTPFYPFFAALTSLLVADAETAARLCSLIFSVVLFGAVAAILVRLVSPVAALLGLVLVAFSPYLIGFSISILSEPTYVAVVYVGLAYLLARLHRPSAATAAIAGVLFGLTFLNRVEGLLFIAVVPFVQAAQLYSIRTSVGQWLAASLRWAVVFAAAFIVIAAPQVLHVSAKMDRFALNGRDVWAEVQLAGGGRSFDELIYGLDYSPTETNLRYLQRDAEAASTLVTRYDAAAHLETIARNVDKLVAVQTGAVGGTLLLPFFLLGLIVLIRSGRKLEAFVVTVFFAAFLVPGVLTDPKPRSIAVAVPLLLALSGAGLAFCVREAAAHLGGGSAGRRLAAVTLAAVIAAGWLVPFAGLYVREKTANVEYDLAELAEPVAVLERAAASRSEPVAVAARKWYAGYLAGARSIPLPYTDYDGLVGYLRANAADYLFLEHRLLDGYPFMSDVRRRTTDGLALVYEARDGSGEPLELYRVTSGRE